MGQENWETIFFPAKWQSCSPAQPELFQKVFGSCKNGRAIPLNPSCLRSNRAGPGTVYFLRIDTAMESWKRLWIFDCWGPEDAPGPSHLPCCHELLGFSGVCWHWAASKLQGFSILMGIKNLQNVQASLRGLGHQDKFTVMAEGRAICTRVCPMWVRWIHFGLKIQTHENRWQNSHQLGNRIPPAKFTEVRYPK